MNDILTLTGQDALIVSRAANRQAEVLDGVNWRSASGLPEATRYATVDPGLVRLRASARVLVEDILKVPVQPGADLNAPIHRARHDSRHPLAAELIAALDILQREINP